jgi:bacterioferritin-associated ferredoxin
MIVCHCLAVSDRQIAEAVGAGATELPDVQRSCGAGTDCRGCHSRIEAILSEAVPPQPLLRTA